MTQRTFLAARWCSILTLLAAVALTLFACSSSGDHEDPITTISSSSIADSSSSGNQSSQTPSSSSDAPSSSSDDLSSSSDAPSSSSDDLSSSSDAPSSSSVEPSSSSDAPNFSSSSSAGVCGGFANGATRLHQGKLKAQFCDPRDGTKYVYVDIAAQTWMAENLRYSAEGTMGRCYAKNEDNCDAYGRMYKLDEMFCSSNCEHLQWGVADPNDHKINIACPIGWHLPSTTEFEELWTYSDPNFVPGSEAAGTGRNSAAIKLKSTSWGTGANIGTDDYGFSGLPGGYCGSGCPDDGANGVNISSMSFWWSHAYGAPVPLAKSWRMSTGAAVDDAYQSYSTSAFYVRCLKDKTSSPKTPEPVPQSIACNGSGTAGQKCHYGQWKDYFTDARDGKEYPYVEIGGKSWMAANLNYNANTSGSKCYNDLDANCNIYGRLYNIATANDNACPSGWRMPTDAEWTALTAAVGGTGTNNLVGVAAKLKAKSGWSSNGTDDSGFAALPGGYGNLRSGNYGETIEFGSARGGFWWSSSAVAANGAQIRHIGPTLNDVTRVDNDKSRLYSVRCVKD